jgi:hypothetical protein
MNCTSAREMLSLYAGGDLSAADTDKTSAHLQGCSACQRFYESLESNQALLKSLRQTTVSTATLDSMRRDLFPRLEEARLGWWMRLERFLLVEARRPRLAAIAGAAVVAIVSITLFAQLRSVTAANVAVFEDSQTLKLPEDYRTWVAVGTASQPPHSGQVYMSPAAYREYRRSGTFQEGTVMMVESKASDGPVTLEASVKDRRFNNGWGYFRFESSGGELVKKAQALPASEGCVACHRDRASNDHVFTQI